MVFVIVPAFNEEKQIGDVVCKILRINGEIPRIGDIVLSETSLKDVSLTKEIKVVVVDDGSSDRTFDEAMAAGAVVLRHPVNLGQGAALETGNEYARACGAKAVAHFDGDGQFEPGDVVGALKMLKENNLDIVLGSRFLDGRSKIPWTKRYIILPVSRVINYLLTGVKLTDAHNGFRVLNKTALQKIKITQNGMAHNSEIVSQIKKFNLAFAEYPVLVKYNKYGQNVWGGLNIIWDFLIK